MATKKAAKGKATGKGKPAPRSTLPAAGNPAKPPSPQAALLATGSVAAVPSPPKPPSLMAEAPQQKEAAAIVYNVPNPPKPPRLEGELIELLQLKEGSPASNALLLLILGETFADVAKGLAPNAPARKLLNEAANHLFVRSAAQAKALT